MFALLRKIQQRPESERRSIALWTAFWISVVIFIFWLISFFTNLGQLSAPEEEKVSEKASPISSLKEIFSSARDSLKESILKR